MSTHPPIDSRRLMVVDDDPDLADALCELICQCSNWTAIAAYGPADAISKAGRFVPDAILLDMEMTGVDGFDTAARLQAATAPTPPALFAMTGNDGLRELASRDGRFTASMLKPVDTTGLLKLLDRVSAAH